MNTVLITGSNGQVGSELKGLLPNYYSLSPIFTDYMELDITDLNKVMECVALNKPKFIINCAAYTAVDKAESEADKARAINTDGARNLARAAKEYGAHMIHLSTDYVYHNEINRPLLPQDPTHPKGVYAATKLDGDLAVLHEKPDSTIIRTSWVYSSFGHNFVKTMRRLGNERDELNIVADQVGSPTYARDLAAAILFIIDKIVLGEIHPDNASGIFHYANEGICSWYDLAKAVFRISNISCRTNPIPTTAYPTPASRPYYSYLDKSKIKNTFGLVIPHWEASLKHCIDILQVKEQESTV